MINLAARPKSKRVQLMATCLCDAFYDDVAKATVEVLEHAGCEVVFPENQTCCGQPAFNCGQWPAARTVMRHTAQVFAGDEPIIVPSGSCAAMMFHGATLEFEGEKDRAAIEQVGGRTWELGDFLVNGLGIKEWPGEFHARIAFHRACHTRGTASGPAVMQLLESIKGLRILPFGEAEQCCGFGGTFSVSFPNVSTAMGDLKLEHVEAVDPDYLVSGDMSCLMHLAGLAEREHRPLKTLHFAQILRDALHNHHGQATH
jgi:L-lactate dehydrogenase complex protein LldE